MNYRHAFHAGNAADVMKHVVLSLLIERLKAKPAPFMVLDTHAGIGRYDLAGDEATRTGEHLGGITALWNAPPAEPLLAPYLDAVAGLNPHGGVRFYPGSPRLARALLRPQDRLVAVELHPDDAAALRREFAGDRQVAVHHTDGYQALKAHLPPKERRGLALIDPPFEAGDEYARLAEALIRAHRRWPTGVLAAWYPIKERPAVWRFHESVAEAAPPKALTAEVTHHVEDTHTRLNGSGLLIVNPPWRIEREIGVALAALHDRLPGTGGGVEVRWLTSEP